MQKINSFSRFKNTSKPTLLHRNDFLARGKIPTPCLNKRIQNTKSQTPEIFRVGTYSWIMQPFDVVKTLDKTSGGEKIEANKGKFKTDPSTKISSHTRVFMVTDALKISFLEPCNTDVVNELLTRATGVAIRKMGALHACSVRNSCSGKGWSWPEGLKLTGSL